MGVIFLHSRYMVIFQGILILPLVQPGYLDLIDEKFCISFIFHGILAEFWRRWHISLSTWFRDYLYIPLGGSRSDMAMVLRNILIIFMVSGLWHGANWTFIVWGFMNGIYFIPLYLLKMNRQNMDTVAENRILPNPKEILQMSFTFFMFILSLSVFRSLTVGDAFEYNKIMFSRSLFTVPDMEYIKFMPVIIIFVILNGLVGKNNMLWKLEIYQRCLKMVYIYSCRVYHIIGI